MFQAGETSSVDRPRASANVPGGPGPRGFATSEPVTSAPSPAPRPWLRVAALFGGLALLVVVAHATGLTAHLSREHLRGLMVELGPAGFVAYLGLFAVGELVHVPGMVFVAAAILAYGRELGFLAALAGSVASIATSFVVIRRVGGQPLAALPWPWARRVLEHLDRRPIPIVAVLRAVFWLAPAINLVLAMSRLRFRDYMIGSILGLLPPLAVAALAFDWLFGP